MLSLLALYSRTLRQDVGLRLKINPEQLPEFSKREIIIRVCEQIFHLGAECLYESCGQSPRHSKEGTSLSRWRSMPVFTDSHATDYMSEALPTRPRAIDQSNSPPILSYWGQRSTNIRHILHELPMFKNPVTWRDCKTLKKSRNDETRSGEISFQF